MVRTWTKAHALLGGASMAALAMAVSAPALAADAAAPDSQVEEVVVTGFRGSLQQALVQMGQPAFSAPSPEGWPSAWQMPWGRFSTEEQKPLWFLEIMQIACPVVLTLEQNPWWYSLAMQRPRP